MKCKVSVIVPVYNVEQYVSRCLDSLVHQSLREIEIIVVNDGSTDNSEQIILDYQKEYPGKIIYLKKQNGGLSDARNYGIPYANGEYIAFLDSDDYAEPGMYEQMYDASENGRKKVVECDFIWEYPNKRLEDTAAEYESIKDYLVRGRVVAWNKLYHREWLLNSHIIFPKGLLYEDVEFFFSLMPRLLSMNEVSCVKKAFVHYTQRDDSISYKESCRVSELCKVYENAINNLKQDGLYREYRAELEYKFVRNALWGFPLKKIRRIQDRRVRKMLLQTFWETVNAKFPNWKDNAYLRQKGAANLYLRLISRYVYFVIYMI